MHFTSFFHGKFYMYLNLNSLLSTFTTFKLTLMHNLNPQLTQYLTTPPQTLAWIWILCLLLLVCLWGHYHWSFISI